MCAMPSAHTLKHIRAMKAMTVALTIELKLLNNGNSHIQYTQPSLKIIIIIFVLRLLLSAL